MPDKPSIASHLSADLPITSRNEDKLNRKGFAEALAHVIGTWRDKPSLVIGLFGDWGSGKSSVKNLVLEAIMSQDKDSLHVVEFSPWQVSSQEMLSETFFREIGRALSKSGPAEEAVVKRRVARWKKYSSVLSMAGTVARAFRSAVPPTDPISPTLTAGAVAVEMIAGVTKAGAEAVEAEGAADTLTLSELKEQIAEDLRTLDRPILVVLDDIDRLSKQEIRYTLQLVKANADFPNIIYLLLAQKKTVVAALEEIAPGNALTYLEKIVQVSFDVPSVNRNQLQTLFLNGLNELLADPQMEKRFSNTYWASVFPHLFPLFRNLRDLNRFLGALAFHIQLFLNGDTFEVNPVDLIALEAIRLFEPELYRQIPSEKEVLTPYPRYTHQKHEKEDMKRIERLLALASDANRDTIQNLLAEVFPPTSLRRGLHVHGGDVESRWFQALRVCSYQAFDRYFQFATPVGDVSQADIDEIVASMADPDALRRIFDRLTGLDLIDVLLTRIASLQETLPLEHAATFLSTLYEINFPERHYSLFETSARDRARSITYWYLGRLPEEDRLKVMTEALKKTKGIAAAITTVGLLGRKFEQNSTAMPFFNEQDHRDRLNQAALAAIRRAAKPGSGVAPESIVPTLGFWSFFDKKAASLWLKRYLQSREAVTVYLNSITATSEGTGGTRRFIYVTSFENLITIKELEKRRNTYYVGELTSEEADLAKMLRVGIRKRKEGKDHPSMVWGGMDDED
jgi:KAP family P-loop domain